MSTDPTIRERWGDEVYPPYVATPEERRRWDACYGIAQTISQVGEESGVADPQFVWYTTRWLYQSDIPVDDEALDVKQTAEAAVADEYARIVLEQFDALPAPRTEAEVWEAVDVACDALDAYLGDPNAWDLGEYEGKTAEERLLEAVDFRAALHPRDRLGRWQQKLGALRRFVAANRHLLTGARGAPDPAAARALRATVRRSPVDAEGGGLAATEREAHELAAREGITPEAARARLVRAARAGLGRAGKATQATTDATLGQLAGVHATLHSEKHVDTVLGGSRHDAEAIFSHLGNVQQTAGALAHWAAAHHDEISYLAALAHHILRLKGLAAAALEPEGEPELPIVEALLESPAYGV